MALKESMREQNDDLKPTGADDALRRWRWPLVGLGAVFVVLQVWAAFTEAVNWDETALLARSVKFVETGRLQGGGRPGLTEVLLVPFADGCRDAVSALRQARVLWVGLTLSILAGLYQVVRRTLSSLPSPKTYALFAVLLVAGIPVFLRWSLQVRTDQPAIAFALWGGVALLASRKRNGWAFVAGLLVGIGALFTQKAVYVGALVGLLAAIELWMDPDVSRHRWAALARRVVFGAAGFALTAGAYAYVLPLFVALPKPTSLEGGLNLFALYRKRIGFSVYISMLPTFVPYFVVGLFATAALFQPPASVKSRRALHGALAVVGLGVAVGVFHAGAFPYFWMTLGLFPAVAATLAADAVRLTLPNERSRRRVLLMAGGALLVQGTVAAVGRLDDTQAIQRNTLAFIARNLPPDARGYQTRKELTCRPDPAPFPTIFMEHIVRNFNGERRDENIATVMREIRERPVTFMVENQWLHLFPAELSRFWSERFVPYFGALWVHGRWVTGNNAENADFEVLRSGRYRWIAEDDAAGAQLVIDGELVLSPGEECSLEAGVHRLEVLDGVGRGLFVLSLPEPPSGDSKRPFFSRIQASEISGGIW